MALVSWAAVVCAALQLVFSTAKITGSEGKEEVPDWTKKLNSQFIAPVRGQRSPSVSRFKSGPAPGAWYYIMGHGRDSKRSPIGGSSSTTDQMDNEIDRLEKLFPNDDKHKQQSRGSNTRAQSPPSRKQQDTDVDNRALSFPVGAGIDNIAGDLVGERRPSGLEEISGRTMLNEFINFLAMKERNLLNNCITEGRRD